MKRFFITLVALVTFSFGLFYDSAIEIFAQTNNVSGSKLENPYDLVSSKGNVISYGEYSKAISLNTEPIKGTGKILPERDLNLLDPKKPIIDLGTGKIINEQPGEFTIEAIFGSDGRKKVSDTTVTPYKQISLLLIDFDNGTGICTGTVVGTDTVLTNAHCVRNLDKNLNANGGYVIPAVKDNHYNYGAYEIEDYYYPGGYDSSGDARYDYAVLKVKPYGNNEIGNVVGSLGYKVVTDLEGTNIKIYGYPYDKVVETGINQWGMSGNVQDENTYLAFYKIDTYNGQSGSAMLNSSNKIVGVHNGAYNFDDDDEPEMNGGPKMSTNMANLIVWASN